MRERRHVLVTGAPRSGNHTASRYFRWQGRDVPLLQMGEDGSCSWLLFREHQVVHRPDWRYPVRRRDYEFDRVLHLVRDPIKVIRSLSQMLCPGADLPHVHWRFMADLGVPLPQDRLGAALVLWTTVVAGVEADETVRLEDWDPPFWEGAHPDHPRLTWREVVEAQPGLGERARQMAADLGYPAHDEHGG
ncbi:MAG TPA: hypothetical protein VKA48_12895 [Gammaproteobacteria bacterium]|nr:hypothetical protein [Gammaproteobacteria bacterium]